MLGFLEAHSAALVQLMLHTLPIYNDLDSQRAVTATVKQGVVNGTFLKTLAGALVKLDAAAVSRQVSRCACHPLVRSPDQLNKKIACNGAGMLCATVLDCSCTEPAAASVCQESGAQANRMPGTNCCASLTLNKKIA